MTIQKTHSLETVGGVSLATGGAAADGADMRRTREPVDGLGLDLLDALTLLAQGRVRGGGLRLVGEDGLLPAVGRIADITADKHMEGVRLTRWLLSPIPTFKLWRRLACDLRRPGVRPPRRADAHRPPRVVRQRG